MHDVAAVEALIERLTEDRRALDGIAEVRIRTSGGYAPEALQQAYEMLTPGTALEGSRLVVEVSEHRVNCPACGARWVATDDDLAGHVVICPACGAASANDLRPSLEIVGLAP